MISVYPMPNFLCKELQPMLLSPTYFQVLDDISINVAAHHFHNCGIISSQFSQFVQHHSVGTQSFVPVC